MEISKDNWKQVTENLKRPGGWMKNPDKVQGNNNPSTIPQAPYPFGVRTQKRPQEASELMRYYKTVGCRLTVVNTAYATVIWSFTDQWASLKDCKRQTQPVVLKITAELHIMRWVDVFDDFLSRKIGVQTIPLFYVSRETALALSPASVNRKNLPRSEEFASIEEELVAQASHTHPLYREDNAQVYYCLKEAVQGIQYALTLKLFQQIKNGRGDLASIIQQFAGADKWQAE
eukprot:401435-Ditylum_brightwellii.AAC.1